MGLHDFISITLLSSSSSLLCGHEILNKQLSFLPHCQRDSFPLPHHFPSDADHAATVTLSSSVRIKAHPTLTADFSHSSHFDFIGISSPNVSNSIKACSPNFSTLSITLSIPWLLFMFCHILPAKPKHKYGQALAVSVNALDQPCAFEKILITLLSVAKLKQVRMLLNNSTTSHMQIALKFIIIVL